jgi:hypothetical protein
MIMREKPKDLYREFMLLNEEYFNQHQFKLNLKTETVERVELSGKQSIYFDPIWSPFNVLINPIFLFRFNRIQQIWGSFNNYMGDQDSPTLVFKLWDMCKTNARDSKEFDIFIEDRSSLTTYILCFTRFMDSVGWGFMNSLNSLNDYDKYLNHPNPMKDEFQNQVFNRRYAAPGLIAAKLNKNEEYTLLYEKYMKILIDFNYTTAAEELKVLKTYLDAHSVEALLDL